jgi:opacity protein-like surface antigen
MNRIFNIILPASVFVFFAFTKSVFAFPSNQFYAGFDIGVGSQALQYNNSTNLTGTSTFPASTTVNYITPFNNSVSSPVFIGSLMLGYAKSLGKTFDLDFEFSARSNAGTTSETDQLQSPFGFSSVALQEYTAQTTINFPYTFDLVLKPTLLFTNKLAGYFKVGPSYTNMNSVMSFTHNNALLNESFNVTNGNNNTNIWGYVVGTGLEWAFTQRFSIFSEYNFHQYATTTLKGVTVTDNGTANGQAGVTINNTINYVRKVLPFLNSFNIGLHYYF